jgi:hypothetical protein
MANTILFNSTIATGGTQQALDPSGVEQLSYSQTLIIKAVTGNSGTVYVQTAASAGATTGFPLASGEQIVILFPSTGLFINGTTTNDKYAVAAS